jgi:GH25 family lysozyme M1 (1,4-beta-N-acetylmuramidase)
MTHGLDISSGSFDWPIIAAVEDFVYIKATDGVGSPNPELPTLVRQAQDAGVKVIRLYHFARIRHGRPQDTDEQCKEFLDACAKYGLTDEPWFDVEAGGLASGCEAMLESTDPSVVSAVKSEVAQAVDLWRKTWSACLGGAYDFYGSPGEMKLMGIGEIDGIGELPLALAAYLLDPGQAPSSPPTAPASLPAPWSSWRFFQYAGDVTRYGGLVDLTVCNGSP